MVVHTFEFGIRPILNESDYITTFSDVDYNTSFH